VTDLLVPNEGLEGSGVGLSSNSGSGRTPSSVERV